ncbi:RusA family crossover junction endodeoxyribonuclease [Enterococcus faecalis]|uniref:RusA family crossover junction endodeoxyribonuclease n=1 Tax=Enterococcus faecalis TaxID=1351 RepID=UPI002871E0C6|nr:RusA family crossover junction endodeoxyribonuclease [Enterococcus faecalis]MDR9790150.1 RusA family crossover junction endodeoxyribonuclease [Enterococcus faecalis]
MEAMRIILPIEPKPQSRPRFARRGNYVQTYEDRAMKEYKNQVKNYLRKSRAKLIEKGPISAHVTFYIHPPKSALSNKQKRLEVELERKYCDKKSDLDNYLKAILDASNKILFSDDGQVAKIMAEKKYSYNPRIEIEIYEIGEGGDEEKEK